MKGIQQKKFEKILKERKIIIQEGIQSITKDTLSRSQRDSTGELSGYTYHMADVASDNYDREFMLEMMSNEQREIWEIDEALQRLRERNFGICQTCGKKIAQKRLEAIPQTRYCLPCQLTQETPKAKRPQIKIKRRRK